MSIVFNKILLAFVGASAGILIAGAYVAFIAMIGIFPKIAEKTQTAKQCILYESMLMTGVIIGNLLMIYKPDFGNFLGGSVSLVIIALFGGIYVGFLAGALSEVLNVFPIFSMRTGIRKGLPLVLISIAFGKSIFSLIQYFILK